ncbi:metallophosphoesterase [Anaerocolumna aminovalerica]|uniref:metallophosphoesterase n=1 Tax=Anaerocolumna aminovalerica TaxID=1527 RepID=UPI001C0EF2F8|nr:metallophosphoesterase [Anaerocolumna aminovalerica]MBU5332084.1 metallophosphoesterase [Anaerocolumna aminovalerica]
MDDIETAKKKYHNERTINKDGSQSSNRLIEMSEEQSKDVNYILKAHGFDNISWELVSAKNNIWNVYSKQDGISTLYSSKITVKPIELNITSELIEEWFAKLDRHYSLPQITTTTTDYLNGDKLLLIDISDLHLNLQASMFVTGNEYNCDIAEKLFFYVINDVLSRTNTYKFNKIIFTIGGDMINSDNLSGTTTKGTPQSNELHLFDAYERICAMTIKAIDLLKDIAPVDVIYVAGNHDLTVGFKLAKYIDAWFRNEETVNVDYSPFPRKYVVFGKTLFVFSHDGNVKTLPRTIADEARKYWSYIDTTEVFLQHLHSEQVLLEDNNMRIQRLPTISARGEWTVSKGYNSKRQCKSFIFDKEDGMTDILYTPIKTNK